MIDSFESMGAEEEGKFDLNGIFQKLMELKTKFDGKAAKKVRIQRIELDKDDLLFQLKKLLFIVLGS